MNAEIVWCFFFFYYKKKKGEKTALLNWDDVAGGVGHLELFIFVDNWTNTYSIFLIQNRRQVWYEYSRSWCSEKKKKSANDKSCMGPSPAYLLFIWWRLHSHSLCQNFLIYFLWLRSFDSSTPQFNWDLLLFSAKISRSLLFSGSSSRSSICLQFEYTHSTYFKLCINISPYTPSRLSEIFEREVHKFGEKKLHRLSQINALYRHIVVPSFIIFIRYFLLPHS